MTSPYPNNAYLVAKRLSDKYRDFNHFNKENPLEELIFILCSIKTSHKTYKSTHEALINQFPNLDEILLVPDDKLSNVLMSGGLQNQKARTIKRLLSHIKSSVGELSLDLLYNKSDKECEEFLLALPGVGKKVARCVMMYSLNRRVFPVDTHCWRVSRRLGWIRRTTPDGSCSSNDMDRLQKKIPVDIRYSLHVNMVSLGQNICLPNKPRCDICRVELFCKKIGSKRKLLFRT